MLLVDSLGKHFYCLIKANRLVDDRRGQWPYRAVEGLTQTSDELKHGKLVKSTSFPKTSM
jgi:hypothetical protein